MSESYLVLFHVVSAGQNGAELGADEEQIVHLSYAIVDKSQNKVRKRLKLGGSNTHCKALCITRPYSGGQKT